MMCRYEGKGGPEQFFADLMRKKRGRRSGKDQPNKPDSRECPRCFGESHVFTANCPVPDAAAPITVATQSHNVYLALDGTAMTERGMPFCRLCFQWGHQSVHCIVFNLCNRWGHSFENCGSGLNEPRR